MIKGKELSKTCKSKTNIQWKRFFSTSDLFDNRVSFDSRWKRRIQQESLCHIRSSVHHIKQDINTSRFYVLHVYPELKLSLLRTVMFQDFGSHGTYICRFVKPPLSWLKFIFKSMTITSHGWHGSFIIHNIEHSSNFSTNINQNTDAAILVFSDKLNVGNPHKGCISIVHISRHKQNLVSMFF